MKELREQIAEIIKEIVLTYTHSINNAEYGLIKTKARKILSLSIAPGKLWVEKECPECMGENRITVTKYCHSCNHTGIIRREALLQDLLKMDINKLQELLNETK